MRSWQLRGGSILQVSDREYGDNWFDDIPCNYIVEVLRVFAGSK